LLQEAEYCQLLWVSVEFEPIWADSFQPAILNPLNIFRKIVILEKFKYDEGYVKDWQGAKD